MAILPSGRAVTAQGLERSSVKTSTVYSVVVRTPATRVCPSNAGWKSELGASVSTGGKVSSGSSFCSSFCCSHDAESSVNTAAKRIDILNGFIPVCLNDLYIIVIILEPKWAHVHITTSVL